MKPDSGEIQRNVRNGMSVKECQKRPSRKGVIMRKLVLMFLAAGAFAQPINQGNQWMNKPQGNQGGSETLVQDYLDISTNLGQHLESLNPEQRAAFTSDSNLIVGGLSYEEFISLKQRILDIQTMAADPLVFFEYISGKTSRISGSVHLLGIADFLEEKLPPNLWDEVQESMNLHFGIERLEGFLLPGKPYFKSLATYYTSIDGSDDILQEYGQLDPEYFTPLRSDPSKASLGLLLGKLYVEAGEKDKGLSYLGTLFEYLETFHNAPYNIPLRLHALELVDLLGDPQQEDLIWEDIEESLEELRTGIDAFVIYTLMADVALNRGREELAWKYFDYARANLFLIRDMSIEDQYLMVRVWEKFSSLNPGSQRQDLDRREGIKKELEVLYQRLYSQSVEDYSSSQKDYLWLMSVSLLELQRHSKALELAAYLLEDVEKNFHKIENLPLFLLTLAHQESLGLEVPPLFYPLIDQIFDQEYLLDQTLSLQDFDYRSPSTIVIWTQEGEADGAFQYVQGLTEAFRAIKSDEYPDLEFDVKNRMTENLKEDFIEAGQTPYAPDLVWTISDHAGFFYEEDIILPLDELVDLDLYREEILEAVKIGGQIFGLPVNAGNHLMLYYNKELISVPPKTTEELIQMTKDPQANYEYALVFDQTESFWLIPWLGGFGGQVFLEDGVTPNLDSQEMIDTLQFLYDLKYTHGVIPRESDYNRADSLFKEGRAAMIINGDWIMGEYFNLMGDKIGIARIPMISETGLWPAPYFSGKYMMLHRALEDQPERLQIIVEFMEFATNLKNQQDLVYYLTRLPALKEAYDIPLIDDPWINQVLMDSADQLSVAVPMPGNREMRYNWDAIRPWLNKVMNGSATPSEAARGCRTTQK
jgi:arabinogalactan oligomer/maltooligosaccharide transport system substrate-binding protein